MPLCAPAFQSAATMLVLDQPRHVRLEREGDDVGVQAGLDRAALVAGGAVRLVELDSLARPDFWKPIIFAYASLGVE